MRPNPTYPLPDEFPDTEPALLTRSEFLSMRNAKEKYHASDAYETTLSTLNPDRDHLVGTSEDRRRRKINVYQIGDSLVFRDAESSEAVGVLMSNILYRDRFREIPPWYSDIRSREIVNFSVDSERQVKYPEQEARRAYNVPGRNHAEFPHLIQRVRFGRDHFEVKAAAPPRPDKLDTIVIMNGEGLIVAEGSNEWGATLLRVAQEYQGRGIGKALAALWYEFNPRSVSGGFTRSGEANAVATWESRVREFLARGWYSALIQRGSLTKDRVHEILSALSKKGRRSDRLPEPFEAEPPDDLRVYVDDDGVSFVLYDARFLEDQDDKYIHGFGFLRSSEGSGTFFYRLEHDDDNKQLATAIGLQLARDQRERLFVENIPGDLVEWELVPFAQYEDGYVQLTKDVVPLKQLAQLERRERGKVDQYGQLKDQLLELAESKEWGQR